MFKPFSINLQLFAEGDDDLQQDKTFTQADVDRIVGERLGREKTKYADYDDLKELVPIIQEFGYQGTPAEIKAALRAESEGRRKQAELAELQDQADKDGASPELLAKIKALEAKVEGLEGEREASKQAAKDQEDAIKHRNAMVEEFTEEYPEVDLDKLSKNDKFMDYVKDLNPNLTISQAYKSFVKFVGQAEADTIAKIKSNIDRSTSSGKAKGDVGNTHGLTANQMALADQNSISYKAYSEMLSLVKR